MPSLAGRLKEARSRVQMTQAQVGAKLGVDGQSVSDWERGKNRPDQERLPAIAELYGVNLLWLLQGKGPILANDPAKDFLTHPLKYGVTVNDQPMAEGDMKAEIAGIFDHLSPEGRVELLAEARRLLAKEVLADPLQKDRRA